MLVPAAGPFGEDLDREVRSALYVLLGDDRRAFARDEKQVRLDDVVLREQYVDRSCKEVIEAMISNKKTQSEAQRHRNLLVFRHRRRGHVVLSVEKLVTMTVVWKEKVILVGELVASGVSDSHGAPLPGLL